jgi:hypothetical protein
MSTEFKVGAILGLITIDFRHDVSGLDYELVPSRIYHH